MSTLNEAITLYNEGKYIEAFKEFNTLDDSIDLKYYLGLCYFNGNGCKLNFIKAFECFSYLAINKYEESYFYLGYLYEFGLGVPRNYRQAILWYKYSVETGNIQAMYRLGYINKNFDLTKSLKYLDMAISKNHAESMMLKSELISDKEEQLALYNKAAMLGNKNALFKLSKYYIDNNIKHEKLKYFLTESIKLGNINTYPLYAKALFNGVCLDKDDSMAISLLEAGAKLGNVESKRLLGDTYRDGVFVEKDLYKAILYYQDCAKSNDLEALYNLVKLYYDNPIFADHDKLALFYLTQIANLGEANANRYCAIMYEKGICTEPDLEQSYYFYNRAANLGDEYSKKEMLKFKKHFNKVYVVKEK